MKISFPHMGHLSIAVETAIKVLGGDVVVPPYNSKRSLTLGTRNSPESVCLPYKLLLGNYIEAIEAGADAILMIECPGVCRLGQYSDAAKTTLSDMGYDVKFINFDLYKGKSKEIYTKFKSLTGNGNPFDLFRAIYLGLVKIDLMDKMDKAVAYYRPREIEHGSADKIYQKGLSRIRKVMTIREAKAVLKDMLEMMGKIPVDLNKQIINVDLTGEIFVVLDPFSNLDIEKELGKLGVHVNRKINLSDWTNAILKPTFINRQKTHGELAQISAYKYLKRDIGGDAVEVVGDTVFASESKSDGVIHLLPFTCMPEIISQNILPNIRHDSDIPVLSLVLDEQMGKAGYVTRLEAFVDLIRRKKFKSSKEIVGV